MQIRLRQPRGAVAEAPVYPSEPLQQPPRPSLRRWNQHRTVPRVSRALTSQQPPLVLLPQFTAQRKQGEVTQGVTSARDPP